MPAATPRIRFLDALGLPGVHLVLARGVSGRFPAHAHDDFCVGTVEAGQRVISLHDRSFLAPEHGLFVVNPGQRHVCEALGPHGYSVLALAPGRLAELCAAMDCRASAAPRFEALWIADRSLERAFRRLIGLLTRPAEALEREEALQSFLAALFAHAAPGLIPAVLPGRHGAAVERVAEYIREHHAESLRLDDLAALAGLSAFHFQRVFQQATGLSPHEYHTRERIRRSRALLDGGASLSEAALAVGFSDQSHLARAFKRLMGIPPGAYRRNHG
ncbi:Helix-turn-helix, AraC domain-containing protein [Desulfovibrio sp. X2]|uniref:AraC family transcriptional regulator n=1 Tax=Desulfovibrio sp. X2 TaxID=941449 RepID=UPI000358CE48|nr:AraC family transcriptional regulator [Desulfovibrio sp. X2]EPR44260.1 Helix-turn-helix, AraC domain-containing protein [Desulfovibrio sp. X2]